MSRRPFYGIAVQDESGTLLKNLSGTGTVWDSQTGGARITDLVDNVRGGSTDGFISTDASGEINFQGPATGTGGVWIDFSAGRYFVTSSDSATRLDTLETAVATALSSTAFGVATSGVPGPLDDNALIPPGQIPNGAGGFAQLDSSQLIGDDNIPSWYPVVAQYDGSAYPTRSTLTTDTTRMVIWKGPTDPTFGASYALAGVDVWFQET